jgi:Holliday junction resolvase
MKVSLGELRKVIRDVLDEVKDVVEFDSISKAAKWIATSFNERGAYALLKPRNDGKCDVVIKRPPARDKFSPRKK